MEYLFISRKHWDNSIKGIIKKDIALFLFLLMSSRVQVNAPREVSSTEYQETTGHRLREYKKHHEWLLPKMKDGKPQKSFLKIPIYFFTIPLKNTLELKVSHFYISWSLNKDFSKSRNPNFKAFCDKYGVENNKQNKYKFNRIILSLPPNLDTGKKVDKVTA